MGTEGGMSIEGAVKGAHQSRAQGHQRSCGHERINLASATNAAVADTAVTGTSPPSQHPMIAESRAH
jgi:hypothetical protein